MRTKVFICYCHKKKKWLKRLRPHLKLLEDEGIIDPWDDTRLKGGEVWNKEIDKALKAATVAVLLISADFFASDFIVKKELPRLLQAAEDKTLVLLPVMIADCLLPERLERHQFINRNKPLSGLNKAEQNDVWVQLARRIKEIATPETPPEAGGTEQAPTPAASRRWSRFWPTPFGYLCGFTPFAFFQIMNFLNHPPKWGPDDLPFFAKVVVTVIITAAIPAGIGFLFINLDLKRISQPHRFLWGLAISVFLGGLFLACSLISDGP